MPAPLQNLVCSCSHKCRGGGNGRQGQGAGGQRLCPLRCHKAPPRPLAHGASFQDHLWSLLCCPLHRTGTSWTACDAHGGPGFQQRRMPARAHTARAWVHSGQWQGQRGAQGTAVCPRLGGRKSAVPFLRQAAGIVLFKSGYAL